MSIGVAVPCFNGHLTKLKNLLDSIELQTIKPIKVTVSTSSTKSCDIINEDYIKYTFPLEIIFTEELKISSQNRNMAVHNLITTVDNLDYITFIDADDVMHCQRIEFLLKTFFYYDSDIILHNYFFNENNENNEKTNIVNYLDLLNNKYDSLCVHNNSLERCLSGCIKHICYQDENNKIHHSQVSVKKYIFNSVMFPENIKIGEDCFFCYQVFELPNIKNAYISNKLSYYDPSETFL